MSEAINEVSPFDHFSAGTKGVKSRTSQFRSEAVYQIEPKYFELARAGVLYGANNGSAVGLGDVEAIPTVTASYGLYNNHDTKSLVVLRIACMGSTITVSPEFALIAGLPGTPQNSAETKYANSLALAINGSDTPGGYLTDAVTLTSTPLWMTIAKGETASGLLGSSAIAEVEGLFIVKPGFCLGIDILASAGSGTPKWDVDILWAEFVVDSD